VEFLIRGGAFDTFDFSKKSVVDNLETIWNRKALPADEFQRLVSGPDWSEDDFAVQKSQVNPVFQGKHPVEPHLAFLESMRGDWLDLGSETLWDNNWGFVYGVIIEIKYNCVGDFHTGPAPTDFEKMKQHWGERYANINVEDISGKQQRMKVDVAIFNRYRHVVDLGVGTLIIGAATFNAKWKSIRLSFLHNLLDLRNKVEQKLPLDTFERCYYQSGKLFKRLPGHHLLTHVHTTWDKNQKKMARLGLYNGQALREAVIFQHLYSRCEPALVVGSLLDCDVEDGIVQNIRHIRQIST